MMWPTLVVTAGQHRGGARGGDAVHGSSNYPRLRPEPSFKGGSQLTLAPTGFLIYSPKGPPQLLGLLFKFFSFSFFLQDPFRIQQWHL